jgi:hypothetical protein
MNRRRQGDLGELSAAAWFAGRGATVAWPIGHSPHWDLVVEWNDRLHRVQVKTCSYMRKNRWPLMICTRGGNQSWSGMTKQFDRARCDTLFAHVGDGRRWVIPADAVEGGTGLLLGGPKYAEWEVERGDPLPAPPQVDRAA